MQQMDITTGYRKACVVVEVVGGILRNRDRDPVTSQGLLCYRDGLAGIGDLPDSEGSVPEQYRITVDGDLFKLDIQDRLNGGIVDAGSVGGDLGVGCGVVGCDLKRGVSNWVGLTIRLDYGILRDAGLQRDREFRVCIDGEIDRFDDDRIRCILPDQSIESGIIPIFIIEIMIVFCDIKRYWFS